MTTWVLIELTLAFIVFCADSVGDENRRPLERLVRALLWMVTLTRWFTHRNVVKLGRFGAVVWFLVTAGWLMTLEYDRVATPSFFILAELTMGFVVYCVDALSADLHHRPGRRFLRSGFWVVPITRYLRAQRQRGPHRRQRHGLGAAHHRLAPRHAHRPHRHSPGRAGVSVLDIFREHRPFPGQDPWVVAHEGSLLLVQSAGGDRRIVVKRFHDLEHLDRYKETTIWAPSARNGHGRQLWAPELHEIEGRWYLYYAAGDGQPGDHRMWVLVADDPLGPYRELGPVGDPEHDAWAIDLTVFTHARRLYGVWSGWDGPDDGFPQNLYIAPMANPRTIAAPRRCLSRPQYDWEMSVAPVNEGPQVLRRPGSDRLFVLYAADASWTQAYKTGLLEWTGGDVTDPGSWQKLPRPFFTGGGHGCVVDVPGGTYFVYHRKVTSEPGWADREICFTRLGWDATGLPVVRPGTPPGLESATTARGPRPVGLDPGLVPVDPPPPATKRRFPGGYDGNRNGRQIDRSGPAAERLGNGLGPETRTVEP